MSEYKEKRKNIMAEYRKKALEWISNKENNGFADVVPFFLDGIVDEETWFAKGNIFRPLFIMKEPSTGIDGNDENEIIDQLKEYIKVWGLCYDHTCEEYGDIRIGIFPTWMRIAKLTKALEIETNCKCGFKDCSGEEFDFRFKKGELNPKKEIVKKKYLNKTDNAEYTRIINKIAVLNIKKIGSGTSSNTILSEMGYSFDKYLKNSEICDILRRQIEIIDPTIIIVCGKGLLDCVNEALGLSNILYSKDGQKIICIESYHPSYIKSDNDHCKYVIENFREKMETIR